MEGGAEIMMFCEKIDKGILVFLYRGVLSLFLMFNCRNLHF